MDRAFERGKLRINIIPLREDTDVDHYFEYLGGIRSVEKRARLDRQFTLDSPRLMRDKSLERLFVWRRVQRHSILSGMRGC